MIHSMTAFARQEGSGECGALGWELRSVNHRYLEISARLPDDFRVIEMPVRAQVAKHLNRGKVDCSLRFQAAAGVSGEMAVNKELARQLSQASREVDALLYNPGPVSSMDILRWPGVLQTPALDLEAIHHEAMDLLELTLQELVETRAREGARLKEVIEQRLDAMEPIVAQVREQLPDLLAAHREKLHARLAELKAELDTSRLEQEMVFLAQRMDVDEELERLAGHIEEVRRVLGQDQPKGRRLDFLMQELHREANTLGSKSVAAETTRASVDLKVLIEQMREQVQNIE